MTKSYDFLKSNRRYFISLAHFYGNISLMNYKSKDIAMATDYLIKFESVMDNNKVLSDINKIHRTLNHAVFSIDLIFTKK